MKAKVSLWWHIVENGMKVGGDGHSLGTLVVGLGCVLEVASVLNGNSVTLLGDGPVALGENSLCDTHV